VPGDKVLDNQEYQAKLLKEVLLKAKPDEKQQYEKILQRKNEISQKMQQISSAQETLNEKDKHNVLPEKPSSTSGANLPVWSRQAIKDAADFSAKVKRYSEALEAYHAENAVILKMRMERMQEFLALKAERDGLEEKEKWLLLTIAIRSQPNLLNFMQIKEDNPEKTK
jgi:hypothetical protein